MLAFCRLNTPRYRLLLRALHDLNTCGCSYLPEYRTVHTPQSRVYESTDYLRTYILVLG